MAAGIRHQTAGERGTMAALRRKGRRDGDAELVPVPYEGRRDGEPVPYEGRRDGERWRTGVRRYRR